jgi:hypothetical protein
MVLRSSLSEYFSLPKKHRVAGLPMLALPEKIILTRSPPDARQFCRPRVQAG